MEQTVKILVVEQEEFYETQLKQNNQTRNVSPIIFLRNFQNYIKAMLINEVKGNMTGLSVLDLCCGRGGDLAKWKKAKICHYVGLDFSETSVQETYKRYVSMVIDEGNPRERFPQILIVADAGDPQNSISDIFKRDAKLKQLKKPITYDVVSTQFAIHYMFESEKKLRAFFRNVTDNLEPGGVFIGTTVDSERLVHKILQSPKLTIENDFFKVVFGQDTFPEAFGQKYYFFLEDAIGERSIDKTPRLVPEYLVNFKVLQQTALEYGLELEKKQNFHEYYRDQTQNNLQNQKLLENMVMSRNEVHTQTQDQLDQQWEIIGLYCIFIFRKKGGTLPYEVNKQRKFDNVDLRRAPINIKSWD